MSGMHYSSHARSSAAQARRHNATAAVVQTVNGAEYGSDDEVYALASAVDAADPLCVEERSADKKAIDPLPPIDHSSIEYDDFVKDFYQEPAEITAMTPAEVTLSCNTSPHSTNSAIQRPDGAGCCCLCCDCVALGG